MVAYCVRKGVPYDGIHKMDVLTFCALHDRMYRGELKELAHSARITQFATQGDGKQLNNVLEPIDKMTGATEEKQADDLNKLRTDLKQGKMR